ncbi:hypothetical protein AB0M95_17075 [Sphaerisporangium sp. NPDC051017]|uniref:hypothetical protein n=1 Tax=Sphaerisporangium sp. NPDC051017 TaxID=3154636 RepID=UPI00344419BC
MGDAAAEDANRARDTKNAQDADKAQDKPPDSDKASDKAPDADKASDADEARDAAPRVEVPRAPAPGGAVVWHRKGRGWLALGMWSERREGLGEDAEPLLVHHGPTREGVVGVFDGAGGAGASIVAASRTGVPRTGAWVGSRTARRCVEGWFLERLEDRKPFETESLRSSLAAELAGARPRVPSRILGSMRRVLPSTMAAVRYRVEDGRVECEALWAGDSRAYALTPDGGLQALTRDHTVETDALEQLVQDPPLTNMLCADRDFTVESHPVALDGPCVLVCATDGCFGYVDTPSDFERHLLGTLMESEDERDWAERLAARVSGYTGDDASLCLAAFGFSGLGDLRERFGDRLRELEGRYAAEAEAADDDPAAHGRWRERAWRDYREGYELLMPPLEGGR